MSQSHASDLMEEARKKLRGAMIEAQFRSESLQADRWKILMELPPGPGRDVLLNLIEGAEVAFSEIRDRARDLLNRSGGV